MSSKNTKKSIQNTQSANYKMQNSKNRDAPNQQNGFGLFSFSFVLGLLIALIEISYKIDPRYGLSQGEIVIWMLYGLPIYGLTSLFFGICFSRFRSAYGLTFGTFIAMQSILWYVDSFTGHFDLEQWFIITFMCSSCIIVGWILDIIFRQGLQTLFILILIILSVFILQKATSPQGRIRLEQYNVIFITIDNLSRVQDIFPDYLDQGVTFSSVYTTGRSHGGIHAALFGGEDVFQSDMYETNATKKTPSLQREGLTQNWLPSILEQKEYTTAAFVSHRNFHKKYGWAEGFSSYGDEIRAPSGFERMFLVEAYMSLFGSEMNTRTTKDTIDRSLIWLASHYLEPFFLWIHLADHDPKQLERLAARMENLGLWKNTMVVVTSAKTSYQKVPLWIFMEKRLQPQQIDCHISNVQIQPTVLEYLGFRVSQNSLSDLLQDKICPSYLISSSFDTEKGREYHFRKKDIHWYWDGSQLLCQRRIDPKVDKEQSYPCPLQSSEVILSNIRMKIPTFHPKWLSVFPD